ncbi:hypothetical protein TNIN_305301 [Trichonephila inaurata madagascariensis]|uniref:Uncharacterized protein n=1 Tax=Trichonephila inaurata madagascariensis TaxID=2747483 RepID=A0A8X6Y879_9ARAC|nr:hypothetical protein TNIN_305301 [Trichonephila inaurata madagascariensis]
MPRFKNRIFKKRTCTGLHSRSKVSESINNLNVSASAKKLKSFMDYSNFLGENGNINEIINMTLLSEAIKISVVCKECKNNSISIKFLRKVQGLATEFSVSCETCGFSQPFLNTDTYMVSCNGKESRVHNSFRAFQTPTQAALGDLCQGHNVLPLPSDAPCTPLETIQEIRSLEEVNQQPLSVAKLLSRNLKDDLPDLPEEKGRGVGNN